MIRLRNIFFLLLLMLLALPITSRAKDVFYIQPFNIVPGDTKTISLNLDNENVYRGFQTDIVLPEGLSIVKQTNNSLAISLSDRASSFALSSNEVGDRTTRLLCYSAQYETISGNSGALVNIQVKASSDFVGGYVQLKNTIFSNENNQDVNMDDSQVSVQTKEQNFISVADDELTAGKGKAFALQLTNETSLTACQFDVVVPTGLSLDLNKCSVAERCSASHQLSSKNLGNGRYRFVCMAMDNTMFSGHVGTILNLWVDAEASSRGNKTVKLENVVFSDAKAQTYRLEPISFDVNVVFYPDIVKVGDLITANIINNGEENLPMLFKVTSVYPFEVEMVNKEEYVEGWKNEQMLGDIEVPASVCSEGISYGVKRIGSGALSYSLNVNSLKLNEGLEFVGWEAFRHINEIKKLVIPNTVKEIGVAFVTECNSLNTIVLGIGVERLQQSAFWGIGALKNIYSLNPTPPICEVPGHTFVDIPDDVTLYVPIGSKEAYETAPGWDHFAGHIVEIDSTGINQVVISVMDNTSWYNLRGVRFLEKPTAPGIYIHGGKKVVIK